MKHIEITEADSKQVMVVYKLLQEAKFEIKGDAVGMAAVAMNWVAELSRRFKEAKEPEAPAADEVPQVRSAPKRGK